MPPKGERSYSEDINPAGNILSIVGILSIRVHMLKVRANRLLRREIDFAAYCRAHSRANSSKKMEAQMRAIIVEFPAGTDHIAELDQIRTWCNDHQCELTSFKYHLNGNANLIVVSEFIKDTNADLFKKHFHGLESEFLNLDRRHSRETMATACWWRLKAEEIRAEYEDFARCYNIIAEHLEHRLARELLACRHTAVTFPDLRSDSGRAGRRAKGTLFVAARRESGRARPRRDGRAPRRRNDGARMARSACVLGVRQPAG
jgi:hypothetical protein